MDNTTIDATHNRPEGDRQIDSPVLLINLPEFIEQIKDEKAWDKNDRNAITIYKTAGMRIVLIALHEDAVIAEHTANGVISIQVFEGEIIFTAVNQSLVLKKGQMVSLHKGEPHSVAATKESVFLLTIAA